MGVGGQTQDSSGSHVGGGHETALQVDLGVEALDLSQQVGVIRDLKTSTTEGRLQVAVQDLLIGTQGAPGGPEPPPEGHPPMTISPRMGSRKPIHSDLPAVDSDRS